MVVVVIVVVVVSSSSLPAPATFSLAAVSLEVIMVECLGPFKTLPVTGRSALEREVVASACMERVACMLELSGVSSEILSSLLSSVLLDGGVES